MPEHYSRNQPRTLQQKSAQNITAEISPEHYSRNQPRTLQQKSAQNRTLQQKSAQNITAEISPEHYSRNQPRTLQQKSAQNITAEISPEHYSRNQPRTLQQKSAYTASTVKQIIILILVSLLLCFNYANLRDKNVKLVGYFWVNKVHIPKKNLYIASWQFYELFEVKNFDVGSGLI
ncbi:hypothetical protein DPMN_175876 [Dreissena polymorpha]|uniref:Uncharacterized protein n=1 Tax=Dreissena polymorpha TaxID=45954 RepID=A0A9D4E8Y1_DREPO|nr:hypothetical protein DPMN_175876 [Dreissena polymorpha]